MGIYATHCELRGRVIKGSFQSCALTRLSYCALRRVEAGGPGIACSDVGDIDTLLDPVYDASPIPANAVYYGDELVYYFDEIVVY